MDEVLQYIVLGNFTLIAALAGVWLFEKISTQLKLQNAYRLHSHLAIAALCSAFLPLILAPALPYLASIFTLNGTELLVSQFLKGNVSLSATQINDALAVKDSVASALSEGSSWLSRFGLGLFVTAAMCRLLYIGFNILKIRRHLAKTTRIRSSRRVDIRCSDRITIPFSTRGLFRYHIVLPTSLMIDPHNRKIALGHEAQHIRQGDVDWEIFLSFVSPLFVLNPAFWMLSDRIRRYREYTCDAAFLKTGKVALRDYCHLLLDIAADASRRNQQGSTANHAASVPFLGRTGVFQRSPDHVLRQRIMTLSEGARLMDQGASRLVNYGPAFLLVLVMCVGILMSAKPLDWSHDRLMLSAVVNLERLDRINGFGVPPLH